jgi:molybdopterin-guanine dinucleotide biosynthesis protein A
VTLTSFRESVRYDDGVVGVSAFILAGGRSSRMGSDKALLPFGNENLLQLALSKAKAVSQKPVIVGERERYSSYGDVVEDRFPGCGPLGGIHAALCSTQADLNLVLSVDMPLMTADFLIWLAQLAVAGGELAFVPEVQGRRQPLCAVYRRTAQCVIELALKMGDFKIDHVFPLIPTRYIKEEELFGAGFLPDIFRNVNTRDDYEAVGKARNQASPQFSERQVL